MPRHWLDDNAIPLGLTAVGVGLAVALWPRSAAPAAPPAPPPSLPLPPQPARSYAPTVPTMPTSTSPFGAAVAALSPAQYERAVVDAAITGNLPASFAQFVPVTVTSQGRTGTFWASPMPLTIGTDAAPFHAPLSAPAAQRIADHYGHSLPTKKMVDAIHAAANVRVPFKSYSSDRQSPRTFVASSDVIEARRAGRTGLVSDYAKDYVLTNSRRSNPARIALYGAWDAQGGLVQPFAVPHGLGYFDYSQHPRFVAGNVLVDGVTTPLASALADPATAALFSDEGPITGAMLRY